jgi:hypothetical protein
MNAEGADGFLKELQAYLNNTIDHSKVREWVETKRANFESDFLNEFVLPRISEYLSQRLSPDEAKKSLLTESTYARKTLGIASGTPASPEKHLFTKVLGVPAKTLVELWWGDGEKHPFSQSCPDWAFRSPCEHTIVFESKLFRTGGSEAAKTELVKGIYQCFYYRGQPKVLATGKRRGWDYDYACLLAYDASETSSLVEAWKSVANKVGRECWKASNIFVMVLPMIS